MTEACYFASTISHFNNEHGRGKMHVLTWLRKSKIVRFLEKQVLVYQLVGNLVY